MRGLIVALTAALALPAASWAQTEPHFEIGGFGGGQFWKINKGEYPYNKKLAAGPLFGGRLGYDFSPRWGVDTALAWGFNNARIGLRPGSGVDEVEFKARNFQWMAGPMYYLGKDSSKLRPFLSVGPVLQRFWPTKDGKQTGLDLAKYPIGAVRVTDNYTGGFYYGGGFKAWLTDKWLARVDLRGILSGNPHVRYYSQGPVPDPRALPVGSVGHGFMATVGLGYALRGDGYSGAAPPSPGKGPAGLAIKIDSPNKEVYQGDSASFRASGEAPRNVTPAYAWRVNDQAVGASDNITVDTSRLPPGRYPVEVTLSAPKLATARDTATLTVLPRPPKDLKISINGPQSVIAGDRPTYSVTSEPAGVPLKTEWKVDGQPSPAGDSLTPETFAPGEHNVEARSVADGYKAATASRTVTVNRPAPPQITVAPASAEVPAGQSVAINTGVTRGTGNPGSVQLAASEGTIRNGQLDTSSVQFDPSATGEQRKPVTITATVTDDRGQSARSSATVTVVKRSPPSVRLPDVVFPQTNSRVNNCGKRVLLEELKAYVDRDPTGKVILVAHAGPGESALTRRGRAMNAAAVITAGTGICLGIDPNRVLVGLAAEGQGSAPQPYLCGTSTRPKTEERSGNEVRPDDERAAARRVEVWFIPTGGQTPPGLGELKTAAEYNIKTMGCPR